MATPSNFCSPLRKPAFGAMTRAVASIAAAAALVLLAHGPSLAGDNALVPPGAVPAQKHSVRPATQGNQLSPSALGMDTESHGYEPGEQTSDVNVPDKVQIGDNTLHFDAKKNDPTPPVGFEANGESIINKAPTEPALAPSYLGLRLTTPLH